MPAQMIQPPPVSPHAVPTGSGAPALQPRSRVGGFETQRVIARSASTVVYLAADLALGMPVALQEYLPTRLVLRDARQGLKPLTPGNADAVARGHRAFVDETRMLVRCEHPALVRVLHLFEANGTAYRAMPYREGRRLLDLRREMLDPPDEAALRALLDALLGALDVIHRAGHVHGGVTPANILLLTDDRPLLLGPGAAGPAIGNGIDAALGQGLAMPLATPAQPAARDALAIGPWADLYGLAQVIRFCISGRLPASPSAADPFPSLAEAIEQSFEPAVQTLYSAALLDTIEAASSPLAADRPDSVAQFREWLAQGVSAAPDVTARTPASANVAPPKPAPRAAAVRPAMPAGVPAAPTPGDSFAKTRPMPSERAPSNPVAPATIAPRRRVGWVVGALALAGAVALGISQLALAPRADKPARPLAPQTALPAPAAAAPISPVESIAASAAAEVALAPAMPAAAPPVEAPALAAAPPAEPERLVAAAAPAAAVAAPVVAAAMKPAKVQARAAATPKRSAPAVPKRATASANAGNPRASCAPRTEFALYRCMQTQCKSAKWSGHAQCLRLQKTDRIE